MAFCEKRSCGDILATDGVVKSLVWKVLGNLVKHNGVSKPVLLHFDSLLSAPRNQVLPCLVIRSKCIIIHLAYFCSAWLLQVFSIVIIEGNKVVQNFSSSEYGNWLS